MILNPDLSLLAVLIIVPVGAARQNLLGRPFQGHPGKRCRIQQFGCADLLEQAQQLFVCNNGAGQHLCQRLVFRKEVNLCITLIGGQLPQFRALKSSGLQQMDNFTFIPRNVYHHVLQ